MDTCGCGYEWLCRLTDDVVADVAMDPRVDQGCEAAVHVNSTSSPRSTVAVDIDVCQSSMTVHSWKRTGWDDVRVELGWGGVGWDGNVMTPWPPTADSEK